MKKYIAKIKRFIYMVKLKWRLRRTPKFLRKGAFWLSMFAYDTAEYLKTLKPISGEYLDRAASLHGINRGYMTDDELRATIKEKVLGTQKEAEVNVMRTNH